MAQDQGGGGGGGKAKVPTIKPKSYAVKAPTGPSRTSGSKASDPISKVVKGAVSSLVAANMAGIRETGRVGISGWANRPFTVGQVFGMRGDPVGMGDLRAVERNQRISHTAGYTADVQRLWRQQETDFSNKQTNAWREGLANPEVTWAKGNKLYGDMLNMSAYPILDRLDQRAYADTSLQVAGAGGANKPGGGVGLPVTAHQHNPPTL